MVAVLTFATRKHIKKPCPHKKRGKALCHSLDLKITNKKMKFKEQEVCQNA